MSNEKFIKRLNDLNKYFQDELAKYKDSIPQGDEDTLEEAFFKLSKEQRDKIMEEIESSRKFNAPINNIVSEVKKYLETMIVSQKPKDKLGVKEDKNGSKQLKIRAALHQETYYGKTLMRDTKTIDISALKVKDISQIIDPVLRKEIDIHRRNYETMKEAFTGEGLIVFNESRFQNKNKKALKPPVYKIKLWYSKKENEEKLQQLYEDNPNKSVITGDNYMFVVMEQDGKRIFDIASLYDSVSIAKDEIKENQYDIESIKRKICEAKRLEDKKDKKNTLLPKPDKVLFYLQQNDLVYMPKENDDEIVEYSATELKNWLANQENKKDFAKRIYKVVKFTGKDCFFIPNNYAKEISISKDLSEEEKEKLQKKYSDKKIPKQELNYAEFSSFGNCVKVAPNEDFVKYLNLDKQKKELKKADGEESEKLLIKIEQELKRIKLRKIQDHCIKIKTDWLGNIIEFNGKSVK